MRISVRTLVSLIVILGACVATTPLLFGSQRPSAVLCASDNFDRSGPGIGSDWTMQNWAGDPYGPGNMIIDGNQVQNTGGLTYGVAFFNAAQWGANQWSQVTLTNVATWAGPAVRVSSSGYYIALANATSYYIRYRTGVNGYDQYVDIASNVPRTFSSGDVVKLSVTGNVLKIYQNDHLLGTYTDTNNFLTSGSPGIFTWNDGNGIGIATIDNWSACSN
jgi:hypothetical protein